MDIEPAVETSANVLAEQMADEVLLLDFEADRFLALNPVAGRMWEVLARTGRRSSVVEALLQDYDVDEASLRADVDEFVEQLVALGLARPV